ncbi:exodeoxyribonuclease 7 small subunit [Vibrio ezurae NBRC 102218]|uniref:Exodeoxyribonuclease 7 small subunit n=2 Tax=Vibrio ezurae TaxID=252583 RepID=U3AEN2_9VIBR|nr:exodeoxyribonuclease 7 small subunit [Vibrio ezurae NBRC 102218]
MTMATKKPENMSFEESLKELDNIVNQLEQGDLELDSALKNFERGIALARAGQTKLDQAEQRVSILMENQVEATPQDFKLESGDDSF